MSLRTLFPLALLAVAVPALAAVGLDTSGSTVDAEPGVPVAFEVVTGSIYDVQFDAQVTLNVGGTPQTQTRTCAVNSSLELVCSGVGSVELHAVDGLPDTFGFNVAAMHPNIVRVVLPTFESRGDLASWWVGYLTCGPTEEEQEECDEECGSTGGGVLSIWQEDNDGDWFCFERCECFIVP